MSELQTGIFVPQDTLTERLRILEKIAQCTKEQAIGLIVTLWMRLSAISDERGTANAEMVEAEPWLTSERLELFELAGLIRVDENLNVTMADFDLVASPARRLKEHDDKLDKKRHLDMSELERLTPPLASPTR